MFNISNSACFIGTLEDAPRIAKEQDGACVATFVLACRDNFLKRDGSPSVQYLEMAMAIPAGRDEDLQSLKSLKKGDLLGVSARLASKTWTDDEGYERSELKIVAETIAPMDA